jgi:hypothetical protein
MRIRVHPRVTAKRPEIRPEDVKMAVQGALRSRARATDPVQWVGVGMDAAGRLLEFVAVEEQPDEWLVFHAMAATGKVLREVGLGRSSR